VIQAGLRLKSCPPDWAPWRTPGSFPGETTVRQSARRRAILLLGLGSPEKWPHREGDYPNRNSQSR